MQNAKKLLVIDWDYFFPVNDDPSRNPNWMLYDWGHRETPLFISGPLWAHRAIGFLTNGLDLPGLSDEWRGFWGRFTFTRNPRFHVADSNAYAAHDDVMRDAYYDEVWLYDAHHDAGYDKASVVESRAQRRQAIADRISAGRWGCDDWMILYHATGARLHVRYPKWKVWAFDNEPMATLDDRHLDRQIDTPDNRPTGPFSGVFLCRSGAWTPPWHDKAFLRFISRSPMGLRLNLATFDDDVLTPRSFSLADCTAAADGVRRVIESQRQAATGPLA